MGKIITTLFVTIILAVSINYVHAATVNLDAGDSIQEALALAQPGDTIHLNDGVYFQNFDTVRDGTIDKPIIIEGGKNAVIKGDRTRMIQVFHDNIHLKGFTVDGFHGNDKESIGSYTDKLIYVQGTGFKKGVEGFKLLNMTLKNSGGEALRLRYFIKNAVIFIIMS